MGSESYAKFLDTPLCCWRCSNVCNQEIIVGGDGNRPDLALNDRIHHVFPDHCAHQMLPLELPRSLLSNGFSGISSMPIPILNMTMHDSLILVALPNLLLLSAYSASARARVRVFCSAHYGERIVPLKTGSHLS